MTNIMQELVEDMNYLEKTDDLNFPMVKKWENLPSEWVGFTQDVYAYALPIKVVVNAEDYPFKVYVLEDCRDIIKEEIDHA